ncbi:uncharacterized protein METZ01_LOCUS441072, partial [marine metagenome]
MKLLTSLLFATSSFQLMAEPSEADEGLPSWIAKDVQSDSAPGTAKAFALTEAWLAKTDGIASGYLRKTPQEFISREKDLVNVFYIKRDFGYQ